jgi:(p)ppGpp synthase/HD superfamily hydrolase
MKKRMTLIDEARYLAISLHGMQKYDDGFPYYYHLEDVVDVLLEFGFTEDKYIISGYLHDAIEDTPISYNDIKKKFGEEIAEIIYCLTDELGRNRKERKEKTYPKIKSNRDSLIVKLADRIANMKNSIKRGHRLGDMYKKEFPFFKNELYFKDDDIEPMWANVEYLTNLGTTL